jgi:DNA helicase-2/ATP-dependent DNA helicase PcrA
MSTGDPDRVEEERRLFYVALTRARNALHVYVPLRYHRPNRRYEDRHLHAQLTRFLPDEVRSLFERRTTVTVFSDEEPVSVGSVAGSPDAALRSLWAG